ncbi:MAG: chloride channel protein [Myxococcales bacterium]|nr:chloride channel protein [Myxococcales bacterium]
MTSPKEPREQGQGAQAPQGQEQEAKQEPEPSESSTPSGEEGAKQEAPSSSTSEDATPTKDPIPSEEAVSSTTNPPETRVSDEETPSSADTVAPSAEAVASSTEAVASSTEAVASSAEAVAPSEGEREHISTAAELPGRTSGAFASPYSQSKVPEGESGGRGLRGFVWLARLLDRWEPPKGSLITVTAILVGVLTALGAAGFIWLINMVGLGVRWSQQTLGLGLGQLVGMAIAGILVGAMVARWAHEAKGHGVPEVMMAVAVKGGRIRPRVAGAKVLASSLTIGAGGSAGREGPIVQIGSAVGSTIGQLLHLSSKRVRILVACGAASGIAATFNAPIAGTIFALEVILASFTVRYFGAVVISAVSASVVSRALLGSKPAFVVPHYPLHHIGEIPIYMVLAVLAAVVAVLFIRAIYFTEDLFERWKISQAWKAGLGMFLTGVVALAFSRPEVLGSGLHSIGETIAHNFKLSLGVMVALLSLKMLATCLTLGSGNSGGIFAPSLFMGAVLGGIVGSLAHQFFPQIAPNPGAYAIVGMAAVFSGAARAPMTAILIVFEMSNDYHLILPLMLVTVFSTLLAERLHPESIYTLKLKRKGVHLEGGRDMDILQSVTVEEIMERRMHAVTYETTLAQLSDAFAHTHWHGLIVYDENSQMWGLVTMSDLERAVSLKMPTDTPVSAFATPAARVQVVHPDESMGEALARMGLRGFSMLPVVPRHSPTEILGVVQRKELISAYNMALTRRAEVHHRMQVAQVEHAEDTEFVNITLRDDDYAVGKNLKNVGGCLPNDCILISIIRAHKTLIPHGSTVFQRDDQITAFLRSEDVALLNNALRRGKKEKVG